MIWGRVYCARKVNMGWLERVDGCLLSLGMVGAGLVRAGRCLLSPTPSTFLAVRHRCGWWDTWKGISLIHYQFNLWLPLPLAPGHYWLLTLACVFHSWWQCLLLSRNPRLFLHTLFLIDPRALASQGWDYSPGLHYHVQLQSRAFILFLVILCIWVFSLCVLIYIPVYKGMLGIYKIKFVVKKQNKKTRLHFPEFVRRLAQGHANLTCTVLMLLYLLQKPSLYIYNFVEMYY